MISAPYNFVPFNDKVVSPHWIDQVSHDIPFSDGCSGTLEVQLEATTDVFVRDGAGSRSEPAGEGPVHQFAQFRGEYFIPGSSIKGMLRNVLEILSFGSMSDRVNDHKYALRDLSGSMKDQYLNNFIPEKIYCGWLSKDQDTNCYRLEDCGVPGRISHKELDKKSKSKISEYFESNGRFSPKKDSEKAARRKYELFGNERLLNYNFSFLKENAKRNIYIFDEEGSSGKLVFTGQPGERKKMNDGKWTGHHLEFIFFDRKKAPFEVPDRIIEDFFFAYFDHDQPKWSVDWKHWRGELHKGNPIPVFFLKDDQENVSAIGLSYLFKLPYKNGVKDLLTSHANTKDLSDAIFGFTDKEQALKGRVHIGHAFAEHAEEADEVVTAVLSSPKASFFPNYIRQRIENNGKVQHNKYSTYMDANAKLAGWKRYPVRDEISSHNGDGSKSVQTLFRPLKKGATFKFVIQYHNLRPIELGALISAITFHGTSGVWHSLGMGKPLGYGRMSAQITNIPVAQQQEYLGVFEAYMNAELGNEPLWHESEQVVALVTMAQPQQTDLLRYMNLKAHVTAKTAHEALDNYAKLEGVKAATLSSFCGEEAIAAMKNTISEEKKQYKHRSSISSIVEDETEATRKVVLEMWEEKKLELLRQLDRNQQLKKQEEMAEVEAAERAAREKIRLERAELARSVGPGFDEIDPGRTNAFDDLKSKIERWGRDTFIIKNINNLEQKTQPDGYLPVEYHDRTIEILHEIYLKLPKRNKERWEKPFERNAILKKVSNWIGEEKARGIKF